MVVLQPLLDRFVSYPEFKSLGGESGGCRVHVELREWHRARDGFGSALLARDEMELIVDAPVVFHRVGHVVLEHEPRADR